MPVHAELPGSFSVHVAKDYLVFCSAHFITYRGHRCESLHGHNYRVGFRMTGHLEADWYVIDFTLLKRLGRGLVDELDHRVLLAERNEYIRIVHTGGAEVEALYLDRRYCFPREDVVLLPIANTTAELLAMYLAGRLITALELEPDVDLKAVSDLEVEVEESFGQSASYCRRLASDGDR